MRAHQADQPQHDSGVAAAFEILIGYPVGVMRMLVNHDTRI